MLHLVPLPVSIPAPAPSLDPAAAAATTGLEATSVKSESILFVLRCSAVRKTHKHNRYNPYEGVRLYRNKIRLVRHVGHTRHTLPAPDHQFTTVPRSQTDLNMSNLGFSRGNAKFD